MLISTATYSIGFEEFLLTRFKDVAVRSLEKLGQEPVGADCMDLKVHCEPDKNKIYQLIEAKIRRLVDEHPVIDFGYSSRRLATFVMDFPVYHASPRDAQSVGNVSEAIAN